jgi:hypothetical protein
MLFLIFSLIACIFLANYELSTLALRVSVSQRGNTKFMAASPIGDVMSKEKCGPCPLAPKCNGEYSTKGCDGSGKIQGGIATFPFFGWWPIKVFRPCPSYLQAGYQYKREGQTMDQVLFSEPSTKMKEKMEAMKVEKQNEENAQKDAAQTERDTKKVELTEAEKLLEETFGR